MFKHLLVPVDGSPLTERAIQASIDLAQQLGAAITGFIAEGREPGALTDAHAQAVLARFQASARAADVVFHGYHDHGARIAPAIIAAAESQGCDMIVMVTHGRGPFGEFLFGSQTKAVLAGSKLPLLVLH